VKFETGQRIRVPAGVDMTRGRTRAYHAEILEIYTAPNEYGEQMVRLTNGRGRFVAFLNPDRCFPA
jgi:hypothetical protein